MSAITRMSVSTQHHILRRCFDVDVETYDRIFRPALTRVLERGSKNDRKVVHAFIWGEQTFENTYTHCDMFGVTHGELNRFLCNNKAIIRGLLNTERNAPAFMRRNRLVFKLLLKHRMK